LINTWVEKPFIPPFLSHTFVFLIGVEIDSRDKGESPLAVHDYAVVVVFEFIPLGAAAARDFYSKRPDGGRQFRKLHGKAEEVRIIAGTIAIVAVGLDSLFFILRNWG